MTKKQIEQFNCMRRTLLTIAKGYKSPEQLRKSEEAKFMGFDEVLEMSYENLQSEAAHAVKGVREIKPSSL